MATHSSTFARKIPWTQELVGYSSWGRKESDTTERLHFHFHFQSEIVDRGAWWAAVHGVAEGRTWLSNFTFNFHFHSLEKEMATHAIVLAWRIPRMEEPGGLLSVGSQRIGHY